MPRRPSRTTCVCGTTFTSNDVPPAKREQDRATGRRKLVVHCPECGRRIVFWKPEGKVQVPDGVRVHGVGWSPPG